MKNIFQGLLFFAALTASCTLLAQVAPAIEWQKCLGGSNSDTAFCIQQTFDGGFIIAGSSISNDSDVTGNHGGEDYWIVKTDAGGNIEWQKTFGGSSYDAANYIQQTSDNGFIIAGSSASANGDVTGNHGHSDYWILKLDATGSLVWQKSLGGSNTDKAGSIQQTSDGGYIVAGTSNSNNGDVSGNHGSWDYWIIKLSSSGNIEWQKCFGGSSIDIPSTALEAADGSFIIAGGSASVNGDVIGHHGANYHDFWIMKLDPNGNLIWQKCLGGSGSDYAHSIIQITDGNFMIAGSSGIDDGDVSSNHGDNDYWIVKIDPTGNLIWQKSFGGSGDDHACSIQQTSDGEFIVAGNSHSTNGDVMGNHGAAGYDDWIMKLDSNGSLIWQKCYGGALDELCYSFAQTNEGALVIAGSCASHGGDVSGNIGLSDYWILKLRGDSTSVVPFVQKNSISISPNPVQSQLTINLTTPASQATLRVFDLEGRMIALPTTFTNTQAEFNTTSLPVGFYILQIISKITGEIEIGRFVKER